MAPRFDDDFKREVVRTLQTSGLPQRQVAADFGIGLSTLGKWLVKFGDQTGMSHVQLDQQKEIARLRRELKIAQQERDILKKATAHSSGKRFTGSFSFSSSYLRAKNDTFRVHKANEEGVFN